MQGGKKFEFGPLKLKLKYLPLFDSFRHKCINILVNCRGRAKFRGFDILPTIPSSRESYEIIKLFQYYSLIRNGELPYAHYIITTMIVYTYTTTHVCMVHLAG